MSDKATGSRGLAVVTVEVDLAEAVAVAAREITPPDNDERTER
jgi:hypothetical protein